jgi:hypothetical protein
VPLETAQCEVGSKTRLKLDVPSHLDELYGSLARGDVQVAVTRCLLGRSGLGCNSRHRSFRFLLRDLLLIDVSQASGAAAALVDGRDL